MAQTFSSFIIKSGLVCSLAAIYTPYAAADSKLPDERTTIRTHKGFCLDVQGGSLENSAKVIVFRCHHGANQEWLWEALDVDANNGFWYRVRNVNSGKCLDVQGGSVAPGASLIQFDCKKNAKNQQFWLKWLVTDDGFVDGNIYSRQSGLCLDIKGGHDEQGGRLIQWTCGGPAKDNQYFRMESRDNPG